MKLPTKSSKRKFSLLQWKLASCGAASVASRTWSQAAGSLALPRRSSEAKYSEVCLPEPFRGILPASVAPVRVRGGLVAATSGSSAIHVGSARPGGSARRFTWTSFRLRRQATAHDVSSSWGRSEPPTLCARLEPSPADRAAGAPTMLAGLDACRLLESSPGDSAALSNAASWSSRIAPGAGQVLRARLLPWGRFALVSCSRAGTLLLDLRISTGGAGGAGAAGSGREGAAVRRAACVCQCSLGSIERAADLWWPGVCARPVHLQPPRMERSIGTAAAFKRAERSASSQEEKGPPWDREPAWSVNDSSPASSSTRARALGECKEPSRCVSPLVDAAAAVPAPSTAAASKMNHPVEPTRLIASSAPLLATGNSFG